MKRTDMHRSLTARVLGFVSSLVLTLTAFFLIKWPGFFHLDNKLAIIAILILAVLQSMAQSIFFLNVLSEKGPRWNLAIFASTISIVIIVIVGSIWIMNHLNANM